MKKLFTIVSLALILTLLTATTAFAFAGKGNLKGYVFSADPAEGDFGTITVEDSDGELVKVFVPEGFVFEDFPEGTFVVVKGKVQEDGSIIADWVKASDPADEAEEEEPEEPEETKEPKEPKEGGEGGKETSAYCGGGKEKVHPMAEAIAETYGISEGEVMDYFCAGHSFGAIMLALQTTELDPSTDVGSLLDARKGGKGWGQIWKDAGLIGSEKEGHSPPGLLKKPDKETGKPDKEDKDTGKPDHAGGPPEGKGPDKDGDPEESTTE